MSTITETGLDRITRSTTQMKAMLLMMELYFEAAERGETDTLPYSTLSSYLWAIEQDVDAIKLGTEEIIDQAKRGGTST